MKKIITLVLCLVLAASLMTGCGTEKSSESQSNTSAASEKESQTSETLTAESSESLSKDSESTEAESDKEIPTAPVEGLGDKYVDLNNRSFAVNGKVYTLGVNTLQDMIDDGVPFNENDIANANNNLNPDYESSGFKIVLGEFYSAQVFVANYTEANASMANCVLSKVYMPVHQDEAQNILQFAFPLTLSEEELIDQADEPTDKSEYKSDNSDYESHTLKYTVESEKYIGDSGYVFEFANGELKYITIDWQP